MAFDPTTASPLAFDPSSATDSTKKQNKGLAGDLVTDAKRGLMGIAGMATGVGDVIAAPFTGETSVSNAADRIGEVTGFTPGKWAKDAQGEYSDARIEANRQTDAAWEEGNAAGIAASYLKNPGHKILGPVVESLPSMLAGGIAGRGLAAATKIAPAIAGAAGEGATMAGQAMQNMTDQGVDAQTAAGYSAATGIAGGAIGAFGGKVAQRMGVADPDTALAGGAARAVAQETDGTVKSALYAGAKRVAGGAVSEGVFEELPQSLVEQGLSNAAQGIDVTEGMARAGVEGTLAGGFMGGAFNALPGSKYIERKTNPPKEDAPEIAGLLPAPVLTGTPGDRVVLNDVERQKQIDEAQANADALYAERAAFEAQRNQTPSFTLTTDPAPLQERIDAMLGMGADRLVGVQRTNYEKALAAALTEQVGITHDENGREIPLTMGAYLDARLQSADKQRMIDRAESTPPTAQQSLTRQQQVADEESQSQPDIAAPNYVAPEIPVVGPLSSVASMAVSSGAHKEAVMQQAAAVAQAAAEAQPKAKQENAAKAPEQAAPVKKTEAEQPVAPAVKAYQPGHARMLAGKMTKQGMPSEVYPHPTEPGMMAIRPASGKPAVESAPVQQKPAEAPAPVAQKTEAASGYDVSARTNQQLSYLAEHGQPGWKEAAIAELAKRNGEVAPAQTTPEQADPVKENQNTIKKAATAATEAKPEQSSQPKSGDPVSGLFSSSPDARNSAPMQELDGYRVGDEVDVPNRTIGRSSIELLFVRNTVGMPMNMARVIGAEGKRLDVLTDELTKEKKVSADLPSVETVSAPVASTEQAQPTAKKAEKDSAPSGKQTDYAEIDEGFRLNREALKGLKVGDTVSWTRKGEYTQKDGTKLVDPVATGKITKIADKDQGTVEIDGNIYHGARFLTKQSGNPAEGVTKQSAEPKRGNKAAIDAKTVAKHTKAYERELHVSAMADAGLLELAGAADLAVFAKGAEAAAVARIEELKKDAATPEEKAALEAMVKDGKPVLPEAFFKSLHTSLKKQWENAQKEAARDPEQYKETLRWGMGAAKIDPESADAAKYKAGFDHALRGQTKSTLPNDSDIYLKGYNDARAWISAGDGKAWFEGRRIEKQKNTGVVLKRWWERQKKTVDDLTKTDDKAWAVLLKATSRAELFPMTLIAEDATPGAKEIIEHLRANVSTFQEFFYREGSGSTTWKKNSSYWSPQALFTGKYTSHRGRITEDMTDDERLTLTKQIAEEYQQKLSDFAAKFKDVKNLEDIAAIVEKLFFPDGRVDESGRTRVWTSATYYNDNISLFAANSSAIRDVLPVFPPDAWDAKYTKWERAVASEGVERKEKQRKDSLIRPRLDKIIRSGLPNDRGQRNISSEEFKKTFGFADVVLGQYVTAQQGQDHLNYAYDALLTLSNLIGAKPAQLSFGGKLYFTIGALGHGKYAAHFQLAQPVEINGKEVKVPVINVTATRGDGSVLHEYFHAIDFLASDPKLKAAIGGIKKLLSLTPGDPESVTRTAEQFLSGGLRFTGGYMRGKSKKEQALYALESYYGSDSKRSKTDFFKEAETLDNGSKDPYWSNDAEPFARMAEAWGYDTLNNSDKRDDYLVSEWVKDGFAKRPQYRGAPYPMSKERERLVSLFDRLVQSIEWTDAGPVLKADSKWQDINPWAEAQKPYMDALKHAADNIDAIEEERVRKEAQKKLDAERAKEEAIFGKKEEAPPVPETPVAEDPPAAGQPPEADNVGLSEDELEAIFDEEAAALREEKQETPAAPEPGEAVTAPKERWTQEDLRFVLNELEKGKLLLVADGGELGIPTIHDMPSDKTQHLGYGMFRTNTLAYEADWNGGGAMSSTPGGVSYTTISMRRGAAPDFYDLEAIKNKIKGKLLARSGPRAAPKLSDEQEKTAGELAKEMAKYGVQGIDEALNGLVAIFGGGKGKLNSFPGGFDEDSYNAAKPHFLAAAQAFGKAGLAFKDFVRIFFRNLIQQFGDGVKPYAIRFAKDYEAEFLGNQAPAKSDDQAPQYATDSSSRKVAEWVREQLDDGESFTWRDLFAKADEHFGGTQANGVYTVKDAYDAMELGINLHLLAGAYVFNPTDNAKSARKTISDLDTMLQQVATQTKRTAEQDEFQQFSTPPHYAFLANWVANLKTNDTYLEPSAGIGGLAVFAKMAGVREVVVNELSDRRLSVLRNMPFDRFFSENAEQLNNVLPSEIRPTVIVMNPPFSATAGRVQGQRDTMNGAKHIEQALKRLNSGGRLVAIVGEGMAADRPNFRDWWKKIMAEYNVRANVGIDGTGYAKYGTTFDNQILVIDKNGPTSAPVVTGKVKTPAEALNLLENVRATRPVAAQDQEANRVDRPLAGQPGSGTATQGGELAADGADAGPTGPADVGRGGRPSDGAGQRGGRSNAGNGNDAGPEQSLGGRGGESSQSGQSGRGNSERTDRTGNAVSSSGSDVVPSEIGVESAQGSESGTITNSVFEQYAPKKVRIAGAIPHNTPLVESAALASVSPPDATYAPKLEQRIIKEGLLSDAQLESVVYAGQAHDQALPDGKTRRGFFLGDGTGVGKGRQISGVILDNWNRGRKKAIWISKKKELIADAKRDFGDLGGDPSLLFELGRKKIGEKVVAEQGILFAGYPTVRGQTKEAREATRANKGTRKKSDDGISYERVQQIVDWVGKDFDGVLVFDEAHEMGNAVPIKGKRGTGKPSDQALACLELQRALPQARVMYVSATGATEVSNLAYAERLGIWGDGTPFSNVMNFVAEMSRSVSAMELVAQNLKQMGLYLARSLSFDGVQYGKIEHTLTDYQRDTYDLLAGAWQNVLNNINAALETTGVMQGGKSVGRESGKIKSNIMSAFWGSHQRFFNQIITALQMPSVIKQMEEDIAAGKSIVLQITNTNEADQARALAKLAGQKVAEDDDSDGLEELDLTPRDQLIQLVSKAFPVIQYEAYTDEDGNEKLRMAKDSKGNPIMNREAVEKRDELIEALKNIQVPDSPLQMIIDVFGADQVAEITGRTQRIITDKNGKKKVEKRGAAAVEADSESFKNGKKHILIFSQAGGTGFSFHSDRRYKNQKQRVHYVLQPGWSADKAVQGFGRSHRTNQVSPPIYRLITTDIPAQKRFISSIARRLEQLGALTAGQRDTAGGAMFSASDNLESKYASQAVRQFFEAIKPGLSVDGVPSDILYQMGLKGIYDEQTGQLNDSKLPPVTQFLNRMLSLLLESQGAVFDFFMRNLEMQIEVAKRLGAFDDGMQTIRHEGARSLNEQTVYADPKTGASTKYHEIDYQQKNPIYAFAAANNTIAAAKQGGWFKNKHSGRIAGVWQTNQVRTDKNGVIHKVYGLWRTSGTTYENQDAFKPTAWDKLTTEEASKAWEAENAERPTTVPKRLHMVVGGILPIWDRFNNEHVSVVRLGLDDGRRLLGRQIVDKDVADTMTRLNVESSTAKMAGADLIRSVLSGATVEMSNRIKLKPVMVSGEKRVELDRGNRWFDYKDEQNLRSAGVISERIQYQPRWFIPATAETGGPVLDEIMRLMGMNAVSISNGEAHEEGAGNIAGKDKMTPADKAIYGMAAEGKSGAEILKFISSASRNPFYRQLAKLLIRAGINTTVRIGRPDGWKFSAGNDKKYAAAYDPKTDTAVLFRQAASERHLLHELVHAATLQAIGRKSLASGQMKALFAHVKKTGKLRGMYGMSNVDEFVSEAFTNPKFQQALKGIGAPVSGVKTVWHWFMRIVRGILGLPANQESALSQALELGVELMRENMGLKSADNGSGIRYNVADESWTVAEPSKMDDVIYSLQDKHIDTKRVMQAIFRAGKKIRDAFNPYLQEELFHGRSAKKVQDFLDNELRPLLKAMQDNDVDMGDFEEYLWNRHAEERNKQIAKINPDMPDGGSGINTEDARAYLASLSPEQRRVFSTLAAKVEAMNRNSQEILVSSGLETQSTIDAWNNAYSHYVPLQREDVDSGHIGTGKGFSVRGASTKRAMGSGRKVVDIIGNLAMQRERNIVRAEKNRVSNALLGLAIQNPNPDFWKVDQAPKERVVENKAIYKVTAEDGTSLGEFTRMDEATKIIAQNPGAEMEQTWGDRVEERVMPGFTSRDNVLLTRVNGKDHYIIFNERDERAMRMATSLKNLDADNLGRVLSLVGKATRWLASVNTQYNPVFGVINLIRDTQSALLNLTSTPLAGEQKRVLGYTKDALVGIYKDIRAHRRGDKPSSNWAELFEEYQREGGQTGYRDQYANAEDRAESIKKELAQFKEGKPKQFVRGLFGWLSDYNETMENAIRLSIYKTAKEKGLSKQQAASLAKNTTVNFNRKGQMATQVGSLYAFFNASVQGSARIAETLFDQDGGKVKLSKVGKKILAGGILLGSMQALLLAAAGYDDDEPPEFVKERNLVLPIGDGKYLTLAMPLGFHVIPGMGRIATEFVLSGGKDPLKRLASITGMFAESFNPIGSSGFSLQTITPSVVDPLAALAENKDFTGREIYREDFNKLNPKPGHQRAKDVATIWSRYLSEGLNFITGGTDYKPGLISWSPDAIDYLAGQVTGGVGREASKVSQTLGATSSGEDLPLYKVPLLGRFVGDTEGQSGQSQKFYEAVRQINMHEAEYKGLLKEGKRDEAVAYAKENPAVRLILAGNHTENMIRKLRSQKRDLIAANADKTKVREIDERISATMRRFNERAAVVI